MERLRRTGAKGKGILRVAVEHVAVPDANDRLHLAYGFILRARGRAQEQADGSAATADKDDLEGPQDGPQGLGTRQTSE